MLPQDPLVELFEGVALAGLEGELLLGHGLGVELGEGVGGAAEGGVERAVGLVQPRRGIRLPLPGHRRRRRRRANRGGEEEGLRIALRFQFVSPFPPQIGRAHV